MIEFTVYLYFINIIAIFAVIFETNVFVFSAHFAKEMETVFLEDQAQSRELTLEAYERRRMIIRFKEAVSRLLADIL